MKFAKALWSLGSFLVNGVIIVYIMLSRSAPQDVEARYGYINDNWNLYGGHWKLEFLLMTMVAVGALYFAIHFKKMSWSFISVGQLVLLTTYPLMLGGYRNTPVELAEMANQMATIVFVFANLIFFVGLILLYLNDELLRKWLRNIALGLSSLIALVFLIIFIGIIEWDQAIMIGPLINIMYLINAYYGLKIPPDHSA